MRAGRPQFSSAPTPGRVLVYALTSNALAFHFFQLEKAGGDETTSKVASNSGTSSATGAAVAGGSSALTKTELKTDIEARAKLRDMATVYAGILLKYSNYANTQQARLVPNGEQGSMLPPPHLIPSTPAPQTRTALHKAFLRRCF